MTSARSATCSRTRRPSSRSGSCRMLGPVARRARRGAPPGARPPRPRRRHAPARRGDGSLLLDSFALFELGEETAWSIVERADLRYRPPEQIRGERLGSSGNVYSLAAVIVHALTGEPPYSGDRIGAGVRPPRGAAAHAERPGAGAGRRDRRRDRAGAGEGPVAAPRVGDRAARGGRRGARDRRPRRSTPAEPRPRGAPGRCGGAAPLARTAVALAVAVAPSAAPRSPLAVDPFGGEGEAAPRAVGAAAWQRLDAERSDLRTRLAAAEAPQEQAELADRLAAAYARRLARPPGGHARPRRTRGGRRLRAAGGRRRGRERGATSRPLRARSAAPSCDCRRAANSQNGRK